MRTVRLFFLLCLINTSLYAQSTPGFEPRPASQYQVGIQAGTTGIGLYGERLLDQAHRLALRVGVNYLAYRQPVRLKTADDSYVVIDPDFMISLAHAGLRWNPFKRSSFFVTAGAGYTWNPALRFVLTAENTVNFGGLVMTAEDVGTIRAGLRWNPVVAYLGTGFGRVIPRRRLTVGVELGGYYLGKPTVELDYEGFLETTTIDEQVPIVERNLAGYRYLPVLNLNVAYAIGRLR
ncbi:hypothetical protein DYU11_10535 [Fibrisoma montanum]|uniref:Outer membrane protein beta-barrel domain-containing protein n=1 Tax=Fibrisoma montanum TaxID=2305895 RepID=A0A418MAP5_9BACT|nr:hypothetical protein [Fibrisoma montanum]RIV23431.1 hypothetical protein DYU11_10535 [Fibrisoma montanum]